MSAFIAEKKKKDILNIHTVHMQRENYIMHILYKN